MFLLQNKIITGNIGDDTISIIDLEDLDKIENISIKDLMKTNRRVGPWDMTLNRNGELLVLNSYDESLIILDISQKLIKEKIALGRFPICIKIYDKKIYILNCDSNSLSILDESTLHLVEEIYLGEKPSDLQIDSMSLKAYIANTNGNSISIINLLDNSVEVQSINSQPIRIFIKNGKIYILSYINNGVMNFSSISVLDLYSKELRDYKIKGIYIDFVMVDDNNFLLSNPEDGYLYNFNLENKSLTKRLLIGGMPNKIIKDNNYIYLTDLLNDLVLIIDLDKDSIVKKIKVGKEPQGLILL
jgi:YVTN family beta-propeller protein